ncbi:MAG: hypothetical protein ABIN94_12085 [Ferruginibacter sp.]
MKPLSLSFAETLTPQSIPQISPTIFQYYASKFAMANHAWDEPLTKITELNKLVNLPIITPLIGEPVNLRDASQIFSEWWKNVD